MSAKFNDSQNSNQSLAMENTQLQDLKQVNDKMIEELTKNVQNLQHQVAEKTQQLQDKEKQLIDFSE